MNVEKDTRREGVEGKGRKKRMKHEAGKIEKRKRDEGD